MPPLPVRTGSISERITKFRKLRGLTQKQLAEQIGITRSLLARYESGITGLSDELVVRFALALHVSADELLGLKNSNRAEPRTSVRVMRRIQQVEKLPEVRKKLVLRLIDDLIRANS